MQRWLCASCCRILSVSALKALKTTPVIGLNVLPNYRLVCLLKPLSVVYLSCKFATKLLQDLFGG